MDMKNSMIDELREALDVAEDQYNTNLQHHVETVDKLLGDSLYTFRTFLISLWPIVPCLQCVAGMPTSRGTFSELPLSDSY